MKKPLLFALTLLLSISLYGKISSKINFNPWNLKDIFTLNVKDNIKTDILNNSTNGKISKTEHLLNTNYLFYTAEYIFNDDFENTSGWTFTNDTVNKWVIGTAVHNGGSKSLYISKDDGVTYEYDGKTPTVAHAFKNVDIPATAKDIGISFDWKCKGEGTKFKYHYFKVWMVLDNYNPVNGTEITPQENERVLLGSFNDNNNFKNEIFIFDTNLLKSKKARLVFEWINDKSSGEQPPAAIDNIKISLIKCPAPTNITAENITSDSALIKWDADETSTTVYDVYYSKNDTLPSETTSPIFTNLSTNTQQLDGLDSSSNYYVWIRSTCGTDKSFWSTAINFKTICGVSKTPFYEGFNENSASIDCWTILDKDENDKKWKTTKYNAFEGGLTMYFNQNRKSDKIVNDDWLISPKINLDGTYRLKYYYRASNEGTNDFEVLLSEEGIETDKFKQTLVPKNSYNNTKYKEKVVILNKIKGEVNIAWHANGKGTAEIYIDKVTIDEIETCPEPMALNVKDISTNKATISWTDDFGAKGWEYYVQPIDVGKPAETDPLVTTSNKENTVNLDNETGKMLSPNTKYEFYVRTICEDGKKSDWSGPFTFRTECSSLNAPFFEGFNTDSNTLNCWSMINGNGDEITWETNPFGAFEGDQSMNFNIFDKSSENDEWLISPAINVNGTYRLKYHYRTSKSNTNDFEVLLSKNGKEISEFKDVLVAKSTYNNNLYMEKKVIIKDVVGSINIAWHAYGKGSNNINIDNIFIEEVEGCPEPMDLDVKKISHNKATISWTDEFDAKNWEYYVQEAEKTAPTKASVGTKTSNKINIITKDNETGGNLLEGTNYKFYVRTVCDNGENSIWSEPYFFKTLCDSFDFPFSEGFNTNSKSLDCWTIVDENKDKDSWEKTHSESQAFEGNQAYFFLKHDYLNTTTNDDWLISPTLKTDGSVYRIKFYYKANKHNDTELEVLVSNQGIDLENFSETILPKKIYKNDTYLERKIFSKNLNGDINFAWHITSKGSSEFYIDNLTIEKIEGEPEPSEINISGQTKNTIDVEWEQFGEADKWEIIAVPYNEEMPEEKDLKPTIVTKDPKTTIKDLDAGTAYTIYIRAIGKDGKPSIWSTPKYSGTLVGENDNCDGASIIPVNEGIECNKSTAISFIGATKTENIPVPKCNSNIKKDVWFEFTASSTTHALSIDNIIDISGDSTPEIFATIYDKACNSISDEALNCFKLVKSENYFKVFKDLIIGKKYYLRLGITNENTDFIFNFCISSPSYITATPIEGDANIEKLVKDVLVSSNCDLVSNIKYVTGTNFKEANGIGYFNANESDFSFKDGIMLATNDIKYAEGPGNQYEGDDHNRWLGDPDIQKLLLANDQTDQNFNASVLEFDFTPYTDTLNFNFIFASNEYGPKYQCQYSDVFAFFLTDISTGEVTNLAVVPSTDIPISVTTIRDAKYKGDLPCGDANKEYFDKYYDREGSGSKNNPINYDGFTIPMTATSNVKPGQKYHIKLVIADYRDSKHSSAIFLEGGSFNTGNVDLGKDMLIEDNTALCDGQEIILDSGLDKKWATVQWFKDDVLMEGKDDNKIFINEPGSYKAIAKFKVIDCEVNDEIKIEFYPKIEDIIETPEDINFCVNSISGKEFIDLTINESIMFKNSDIEDYELFYYQSEEDYLNKVNPIENPADFKISKDGLSKEIYINIINKTTKCEGLKKFNLIPQRAAMPESPGDIQVCSTYTFKKLPENQHYYSEKAGQGKEYKAGDIINTPGNYDIYIFSVSGDCFEEVSFNLIVTEPIKAEVIKNETLKCEVYVLQNLPVGNRYFTEENGQGVELFSGDVIRFNQTIYVYAQSEQGPNYCIDQSSFTISFEDCEIPRGISPNGDGLNDYLDLEVHGVTSIRIYNRYGTEVYYHGAGYINQWRGQDKNGNELPDGTYYYVIEAMGKTKSSWIQINR